jgi:hypothetical protein
MARKSIEIPPRHEALHCENPDDFQLWASKGAVTDEGGTAYEGFVTVTGPLPLLLLLLPLLLLLLLPLVNSILVAARRSSTGLRVPSISL